MSQHERHETQSFELDRYRGIRYTLVMRGNPDLQDPIEFAVVARYKLEGEGETEIVKIDTADGDTHIHRYYLNSQKREPVDMGLWEAVEHVSNHWREYAHEHYRNHGD